MENFMTWETLKTYTSFVTTVYMVVEFTKELKFIKKMPTRYWSFVVSFVLIIATNLATGVFNWIDILLYALSSVAISLGSNGLSNFNSKEAKK